MALRLPSEIVVERFLPTARAMLAAALADRGLTQAEIADHLGVTQAAVSKYAGGSVTIEDRFRDDPRMTETIDRIATGLASGSMDKFEMLSELLSLVRAFEDRGPICAIHEEAMPSLQGLGCDLCVRGPDADVQAERAVLTSVRRAARTLSTTRGMVPLIPNVGTNVGTALPDAVSETDVAAIPGRIYAIGGRVEVPANPEFGASQHVASAILAAAVVDPSIRGALNVATNDALLAAARDMGIEPLEFDPSYDDRTDRLAQCFRDRGRVPRVIYHNGAFGIEPITYVYGETAVEAVELLAELVARMDSVGD